ncbi:hypothetical protein HPB50_002003 [Hyalomma asiaticum]|uniref:Uncharacterized protein n=1 Tax=Hyalomma asiaticum TaxID=266040 RepID=A0ACB7RV09_HYAAI|nr:hypothetical protein HPB50_002003 [Hyalomma asiaticum]
MSTHLCPSRALRQHRWPTPPASLLTKSRTRRHTGDLSSGLTKASQRVSRPGLRKGDAVGTSKRHSHRRAFRPRKPQLLIAAADISRGAPKSGQQRECSEGDKLRVTSLPLPAERSAPTVPDSVGTPGAEPQYQTARHPWPAATRLPEPRLPESKR